MSIRLFDIINNKVTATAHCYTIETFKNIIDKYPEEHTKIFAYIHYMCSLNEEENPFSNVPEADKEEMILKEVGGKFSIEDEAIFKGLQLGKKLYETTLHMTYLSIKVALENLGKYLRTAQITDGRDGNILAILKTAREFEDVRRSFSAAYKAFKEDETTVSRGGQDISYDQQ